MKPVGLCLLTLILLSASASAENMYRGAWYAVPGASFVNTDSDLSADNSGGVFLRLGKEISPSWDVQFGVSYANASASNGIGGRYKQNLLGVDVLYFFQRDAWRPFLLVGAGLADNKLEYNLVFNGDNSRTSAMLNVGGGVQYLFNDHLGLQADVRQVWSRSSGQATGVDANGSTSNTYFNLGAVFRFGTPPAAAVVTKPEAEKALPKLETAVLEPLSTVKAELSPPPPVAPVVVAPEPLPAVKAELPSPPIAPVVVAPEQCVPVFTPVAIIAESLFVFDKAVLRDDAMQTLEHVVVALRKHPESELVMVIGYTDRIGTHAYNKKLSQKRAQAVRDYLIKQGISASRLRVEGRGKANPIVSCEGIKQRKALIECLQPNRRVEVSSKAKKQENRCQ
ncbi:MAG: OmpA family protein [Methylophilaceae bacterium]|nr:OmpA family protein [Methylophilaceae bacterium]